MALAPWRSPLSRALHRNRSLVYARYLQLATVRPDGRPANRTLVFRGFLEDTNHLKFAVDRRSEKINQIAENNWGEACWYFQKTREQFRLFGQLTVVDVVSADAELQPARQALWQNLSDSARQQFIWPHPGQPRAAADAFDSPPPDPEQPPETFCLLLLDPVRVDHLELRGEPQNRCLYDREEEDSWKMQEVNP